MIASSLKPNQPPKRWMVANTRSSPFHMEPPCSAPCWEKGPQPKPRRDKGSGALLKQAPHHSWGPSSTYTAHHREPFTSQTLARSPLPTGFLHIAHKHLMTQSGGDTNGSQRAATQGLPLIYPTSPGQHNIQACRRPGWHIGTGVTHGHLPAAAQRDGSHPRLFQGPPSFCCARGAEKHDSLRTQATTAPKLPTRRDGHKKAPWDCAEARRCGKGSPWAGGELAVPARQHRALPLGNSQLGAKSGSRRWLVLQPGARHAATKALTRAQPGE